MERINHGVFYKKNIRRDTPSNNAPLCKILNKRPKDNSMVIEEWHEQNDSMDMDVDIDIDSDTAEELSRVSQPMEVNTDDTFDGFDNDQEYEDEIEDNIVNYMNYTSGISAYRVRQVLDLVNGYERQRIKRENIRRPYSYDHIEESPNHNSICGIKRTHSPDEDDDESQCKNPRK